MSNPARELLGIFNAWSQAGGSATQSRSPEDGDQLAKSIRAMELVAQIRRHLNSLSEQGIEVGVYLSATDQWARLILAYPNGWNAQDTSATQTLHNAGRTDMLEGLSLFMDGLPPTINEAHLVDLRVFLNDILALLGEDSSIDDTLRKYIADIVAELGRAFDEYEAGRGFDAADTVQRLWVALRAAEGASKTHKKGWSDFAEKVWKPAAAGLIAGAPSLAIEAIKLITGA